MLRSSLVSLHRGSQNIGCVRICTCNVCNGAQRSEITYTAQLWASTEVCFFFFFFQSTAQLQYVEDSRASNEVNVTIGEQCKNRAASAERIG